MLLPISPFYIVKDRYLQGKQWLFAIQKTVYQKVKIERVFYLNPL
jgi:hypothetical protein